MKHMIRNLATRIKSQHGFTLIELLVVVAIMGALAAVAIPNIARFAGRGKAESMKAEQQAVQAAVDALISDQKLLAVGGMATGDASVTDFSATAADLDGVNDLYPNYIRHPDALDLDGDGASDVAYCWNTLGSVTQVAAGATCPDPTTY